MAKKIRASRLEIFPFYFNFFSEFKCCIESHWTGVFCHFSKSRMYYGKKNNLKCNFSGSFSHIHCLKYNLQPWKWRGATRELTFMFWIIANNCACIMIVFPRMHNKQIELWILHMRISVTFNFRQLPTITNPNSIPSL